VASSAIPIKKTRMPMVHKTIRPFRGISKEPNISQQIRTNEPMILIMIAPPRPNPRTCFVTPTRELEIKTKSLEEINTAMKVLLKRREEDKTELEDNVLTNVKELVTPYFEKIKKTKLDDQQEVFLSIIETNLNEIVSPFTRKMSLKYLNLTPTEIQIANLIKHGRTTKKIAKLLHISPRTVETHRKNMRRKIGLERKRANLRSYLLSLH
jgi:DNA-binding CsgD family transcriptional regulator